MEGYTNNQHVSRVFVGSQIYELAAGRWCMPTDGLEIPGFKERAGAISMHSMCRRLYVPASYS